MKPAVKRSAHRSGYFPGIFDEFFNDMAWPTMEKSFVPSVNVKETDSSFDLEIAAPGLKKEDFHVEVEDDTLTISAEVQKEEMKENEKFTRKEFNYQSFKRSFRLPEHQVNHEAIEGKYEDGILRLHLPKLESSITKPAKRVEIG